MRRRDDVVVDAVAMHALSPERRARRRDSEQRSRQKRNTALESMRAQVDVLESVLAVVPFALLDEEFLEEDELLADADTGDREARAMRELLRKSMDLSENASQLRQQNTQLRQRIQERELSASVLCSLTETVPTDAWSQSAQRWSAITRALFTPWTMEACQALINESMREISRFSFADGDFETTGLSLFGWRDRRKLDRDSGTLMYSFTRTYANQDAEMLATRWWNITVVPDRYAQTVLGPNAKCYYEVVQEVSPDISIVRLVEQYPNVPYKTHMLVMHFRRRARNGYIQVHRSIPCPEIQLATDDEDACWTSNFHWVTNDVKKRNDQGECVEAKSSLSGTFASPTVEYANRWMGELAISLVRTDSVITGQKLPANDGTTAKQPTSTEDHSTRSVELSACCCYFNARSILPSNQRQLGFTKSSLEVRRRRGRDGTQSTVNAIPTGLCRRLSRAADPHGRTTPFRVQIRTATRLQSVEPANGARS